MLVAFIAIIMAGCSNESSVYSRMEKQFKAALDTVQGNHNIAAQVYMVIPRAGCGGCISTAETFMLDYLKHPEHHANIKFVLTDFDSEKLLRDRFGALYKSDKLIIDRNNVFISNTSLTSIYPTIYFFDKDSKLIKVVNCSPMENGLGDLADFENKLSKRR
jgi:hypothetical protein